MWHAIKNIEQNYFFKCSIEEDLIQYYLYDLKEIWYEKCSVSDIIQRAKNLNKRICYDSETVTKTLKSATPSSATIEVTIAGRDVILKYHVAERPFNFEWNLKPLETEDFQKLVISPLFMSIHYMAEQIKELKRTIQKKDLELKQYKAEGFELQRKTVATEEFDEEAFNKRYSQINEISSSFRKISESVKESIPLVESNDQKEKEKPDRPSTFVAREKTKKSPNKKRKVFENRRLQMLSIAKSKQNDEMEFESSQSQSLSQTPPKDELAEIFQSLDELNAKRLKPLC